MPQPLTIDQIPSCLPCPLKFGYIYLVYGSDQQIKIELKRKSIPYSILYEPTFDVVEQLLIEPEEDIFSTSLRGLIIFPKTYKVLNDRKPSETDQYVIPNYQKLQVSSKLITFIIGDPYYNTKELKDFYKKLEGGRFVSLILNQDNSLPEDYQRFPISYWRQYNKESYLSESDLFEELMNVLGTKEGIFRWKSISRQEFYRIFLEQDGFASPFTRLLHSKSSWACRDLAPWLGLVLTRLNKERWACPGELLGRFALWVYRASSLWAKPYQDGIKRIQNSQYNLLVFNPSNLSKIKYQSYILD